MLRKFSARRDENGNRYNSFCEDYKDILDILGIAKQRLEKARAALDRILELKKQEDLKLESWQAELSEIERRIGDIDSRLARARG